MGIKSVVTALALALCLLAVTSAQGPKNYLAEPTFPGENMSGSEIYREVQGGVYTNPADASLSFRNESLFIIRKDTGMSPHATNKGVRTPVRIINGFGVAPAAGSWSFTLSDVVTRYLQLNLYQNGDAVFGSGELKDNGFTTPVTAGGTVLGDQMALFVTPTGSQNLYRFSLTIRPGSMDGDYIFTSQGITQPGVAFGSLIAPLPDSSAIQTATSTQQSVQVQQGTQTQPAGYGAA
jgi:hypothetical protein